MNLSITGLSRLELLAAYLLLLPSLPACGLVGNDDHEGPPESGWVDIAFGATGFCALHDDGSLWCGAPDDLSRVSEGTFSSFSPDHAGCRVTTPGDVECINGAERREFPGPFVTVDGDLENGCALREDGGASCWTTDDFDVEGPFATVAAGEWSACGIETGSGHLRCWSQFDPFNDDPTSLHAEQIARIPERRYRALSMFSVICAVDDEGGLACWPRTTADSEQWLLEPPSGRFRSIVQYRDESACAVEEDGGVQCWGKHAGTPEAPKLDPPADGAFSRLALGAETACGLTEAGTIECWGGNPILPAP